MDVIERETLASPGANDIGDLRLLFHRLNNQLGIILSHAELLEAKSGDDLNRGRAVQIVKSVLEAMSTAREVRLRTIGSNRT